MTTSSIFKHFVIENDEAIKILIEAMEHPIEVEVSSFESDPETSAQIIQKLLATL